MERDIQPLPENLLRRLRLPCVCIPTAIIMAYSQFKTIGSVIDAFGITVLEGGRFFPPIAPIAPSETLRDYLSFSLPLASSASELIDPLIPCPGASAIESLTHRSG